MFNQSNNSRRPRATRVFVAAQAVLLVLIGFAPRMLGQTCPGGTTSAPSPEFPPYTYSISNSGIWAGDQYVYGLSYYGFVRSNISNPDSPGVPQLAQVGFDRGVLGPPAGGGGVITVDCDCHGNVGVGMAAAESPGGDSRLISGWEPYYEANSSATEIQAAQGVGGAFAFGQQVNAGPTTLRASPLAVVYLPSGAYFGYVPNAGVNVQVVNLTLMNGQSGQDCGGSPYGSPCTTHANQPPNLQPVGGGLPWNVNGVWAGQGIVGGVTTYLLVGAGGGFLHVATIDQGTGLLTDYGSVAYTSDPFDIAIAAVKGGAYIFSAEGTAGLQTYEVRSGGSIVPVAQPPAFSGKYVTRIVVRGPRGVPFSPTPVLFALNETGGNNIEIWDSSWLTPGTSATGTPRMAYSLPHQGHVVAGGPVLAKSFGALVTTVGPVVYAYVFEAIGTAPQWSFASTKKDVSCIAYDPSLPATPSLLMTNLSVAARAAAGHPDSNNYQGDRWRAQDTSATGIPLNFLQWDLVAPDTSTASLVPDTPNWAMSSTGSVPQYLEVLDNSGGAGNGPGIFWPCDPSGPVAGDPNSGSFCYSSINSPGSGSFNIKIKAQNANPQGAQVPIAAGSQTVLLPTVYVNGQTGTSADVSVLTGQGVLNALASPATQGNTADATFNWTFIGCVSCSQSGQALTSVSVPPTATGYSLSVTYKGGYTPITPVSGRITQTDIVPDFTLGTTTPLINGPLTLTNTMQVSALATVTSVAYVIAQGGVPVPGFSGNLAPSFNTVNGQATVTVPGTVAAYTITLTYSYSLSGVPQGTSPTQPVRSFTTTLWAPQPVASVYYDAGGVNQVFCGFGGCNLIINTTYYLKDSESVQGGITHPGASFVYNGGSGETTPPGCPSPCQTPPGTPQPTVPFTPSALCSTGCYVKAYVQGVPSPPTPVTVSSSAQPLSASVNGPTNGSAGSSLTYTANVVGGAPPYSYQWACQYAGQFTSFTPGSVSFPCTYPVAGTFQVVVMVSDSASTTVQSSPYSVVIGGGGGGGLALTVSGPPTGHVGSAVTFTANATGGSGGYSFSWTPGESIFDLPQSTGANPSYTHTYPIASTYTVTCTVTSGGSSAQAHATIQIGGTAVPSAAYTVQGATANTQTGNWDVGQYSTVTLTATESPANVAANGFVWDFGDGSPQNGQSVHYMYNTTGLKNVTLTVTGDGVHRVGTATATVPFNVTAPSFQALIVPAAEHQPVPNTNGLQYSRTDVTVGNPGTVPVNVSPAYLDFLATMQNCGDAPLRPCWSFDLSTIPFDAAKKVTIPPKGSWSQADVVKYLAGDIPTKGILVLKFDGGDATPLVTARVYSAPTSDPTGPSAGTTLTVVPATKDGQVVPQGEQVSVDQNLAGLRSDSQYYFRLSLVNSAGLAGSFRITASDQGGNPVTLKDPRLGGAPAGALDFGIGPYQGVDWSGDDLGLNDPSKRYVVKAGRTPTSSTGQLLAFVKLNDRKTGDPTLVTPDTPPSVDDACSGNQKCINYVVPGARRYLTPEGAHWKTSLTVYNPSGVTRGVALTYLYSPTSLVPPEKTASQFLIVGPGQLAQVPGLAGTVCCDDAIAQLFATPANGLDNFATDSAGLIILQHFKDNETSTAPLIILSRTYDDEPTGTVGSQLAVYTRKMPLAVGPADGPLVLTGLQTDTQTNPHPRFKSTVNVFAYEDMLTVVKLTALKSDGTVLGSHSVALNNLGASGHFQPRFLDAADLTGNLNGAQDAPVSIKIEVLQGGHVGAFGIVEDIATHDPTLVQSAPQN